MNLLYSSHLKNTIWITALSIAATVFALSDVNRDCIAQNNGTISNDYLIGTWYKMYNFIDRGPLPVCVCPTVTFTRPTAEELKKYREKFQSKDLPHEIGDDAALLNAGIFNGLVLGGSEAKTYILEPQPLISQIDGYDIYVYRRINEKYMLFWPCSFKDHTKWLLSRHRNATEEEMQKIIWSRPEITTVNKIGVRFCNDTCSTTNY